MLQGADDFPEHLDFERAMPQDDKLKRMQMCNDFQRGTCTRGDSCPYRHAITTRARVQDEVCKYWLRGLCKMGMDCEYLHEYDWKKIPECFFYQRFGECSNPECGFRHMSFDEKVPECAAYKRGFCRYGPRCRLRHVRREACPNYMAGLCLDGPNCRLGHPKIRFYTEDHLRIRIASGEVIEEASGTDLPAQAPAPPGVVCFRCGEPGHFATHCTGSGRTTKIIQDILNEVQEPQGTGCFHCQSDDHPSLECPQKKLRYMQYREAAPAPGQSDGDRRTKCFRCGEEGHINRECPLVLAEREKIGALATLATNSNQLLREQIGGLGARDVRCFICSEPGHIATFCPKRTAPQGPSLKRSRDDGPQGEGAGGGFFRNG